MQCQLLQFLDERTTLPTCVEASRKPPCFATQHAPIPLSLTKVHSLCLRMSFRLNMAAMAGDWGQSPATGR